MKAKKLEIKDAALEEAFPAVKCPVKPLGNRVLVQIRLPKTQTKSGLLLTSDSVDHLYRNEQTAMVISIGAGCFHFPSTGQEWPSGKWFEEGSFVRVPLHGGDNHWISYGSGEKKELVLFKTFKDYEIIGLIEGNPLEVSTQMAYF